MQHLRDFYINGGWHDASDCETQTIINPADEQSLGELALGNAAHVDTAVRAARTAFAGWADMPLAGRLDLLKRVSSIYRRRSDDLAEAVMLEMGAPIAFARDAQVAAGQDHLDAAIAAAAGFAFSYPLGDAHPIDYIRHEPIGVCALITPWNWPMNQIALKVAPALAAGCTVVLKPSEMAPLSALLFAEIMHEAGIPAGVFNLVNGLGHTVGAALTSHTEVDMVSFTGSCRAGAEVSKAAATTFKRVALELGGKSPNIIFANTDVAAAARRGAAALFCNAGQTCDAPSRMLVEQSAYPQVVDVVENYAQSLRLGDPRSAEVDMGPIASERQFVSVRSHIQQGLAEGARLIAGGADRPPELERGYFIKPTAFADVTPDMTIFHQEIFGPVLTITPFQDEKEAVVLANDTVYGLAAYLQTDDPVCARRVASRLRAGMLMLNGAVQSIEAPFGGYKHSGIGREGGKFGLAEFLETKVIAGW